MPVGTRMYREQHAHLLALARQLDALLEPRDLSRDAAAAGTALSRLAGALQVHLAMEDESLYPFLLSRGDGELRERARRFQADLGGMRRTLHDYLLRWRGHTAIERDPPAFVGETRDLLAALASRIAREDRELFALADALP